MKSVASCAQFLEALRHKTVGSVFDSRDGPWKFSSDLSFLLQLECISADTRYTLTEMSTREFSWGYSAAGCPRCDEPHSADSSPTFQPLPIPPPAYGNSLPYHKIYTYCVNHILIFW